MEKQKILTSIEALLFANGDPVSVSKIADILEIGEGETEELCNNLAEQYEQSEGALRILKIEDKYQMCTKDQFGDIIKKLLDIRRNTQLSQAAMEVVAVIAYNQPVTKAFVEQVRGVNCDGVVNSLVAKGLVEEKGRLELPGRPLLYGTTDAFLRCFGISSLSELPAIPGKEELTEDRSSEGEET